MNKKIIFLLVSVLSISAMIFTSCKKEETVDWIKLNKVYFNPSSTFLEAGESAEVTLIALYTDASEINLNDSVQITCSDPSVVKYDKGKITALKDGKATLTASYSGMDAKCEITASTLKELKVTVDGVSKDLLAVPGEEFEAGDIKVEAVYTAGGSKEITGYTFADVSGLVIPDPSGAQGFSIDKVENYTTTLLASYYGVNGDLVMGDLDIHIGALDSVKIYTDATKFDEKGKEVYRIDTVLLGSTINIYADGFFSWKDFQDKDTIPANYLIDSYSFEHGIMDINKEKNTLTAVQVTPESLQAVFEVKMFNKKTYESRDMDIVKDTTYIDPTYEVTVANKYAYIGDIIKYKFTESYKNKVVVDLTNTGNPDIMSTFALTEEVIYGNTTTSTGAVTLVSDVTGVEDSVSVAIVYKKSDITTVKSCSSKFKVYNQPSMEYNGLSIILNQGAIHLWKDDCKIVDNFGEDCTSQIHYDGSHKYVLDILPGMDGKTYTFTYGPEKRTAVIEIPLKAK